VGIKRNERKVFMAPLLIRVTENKQKSPAGKIS
jgi:hypothetical protein